VPNAIVLPYLPLPLIPNTGLSFDNQSQTAKGGGADG
jgi:hypothetical protein